MLPKMKEICLFLLIGICTISDGKLFQSQLDTIAIENFREYLRIPSVHPDVNYDDCVAFIKKQAKSLDLPVKVFRILPKKPIVIITWEGIELKKPSILLNGHMDVVQVFPDQWKYPPFDAHMDEKGDIYARGSQDVKINSIQYLEAIRRLKLNGIRLKRTIHISFVPDEEIGGFTGMKLFVKTEDFKNLNIGFAIDEARASANNKFQLHYGERTLFSMWIHCPGTQGHGSNLPDYTAGEKLRTVIDRFMDFRVIEKEKLKNPNVTLGDVITINLVMIKGGVGINVLPNKLSAAFDIRLTPDINYEKFLLMIKKWLEEAGEGIYYERTTSDRVLKPTKLDESNIFWHPFKKVFDDNDLELDPVIAPGSSDARFIRTLGIPAFGFSTLINTPVLLHASNEFVNKDVFLRGINIFMKILTSVANVE